jgi:putative membrane protein
MIARPPYCGSPPLPGELLDRFNLDPALIVSLGLLAAVHIWSCRTPRQRRFAAAGWFVAVGAFVSPLCALSVSLFSARIAQHQILLLAAAPLLALALPRTAHRGPWALWANAAVFFVALWYWHMPGPYDATFTSTYVYWFMHVTLFGSAILLWRQLLHHRPARTIETFAVGALTSMHMSFLGAILAFAERPLFSPHLLTTSIWGLSPLQDQQLGGTLMWVPGVFVLLWACIRSLGRLWSALDDVKAT